MKSLTKNRLSEAVIRRLVQKFFPSDELAACRELAEGYFNSAYEISLKSGKSAVLKAAPPDEAPVMSYERNLMYSEVEAMKLAASRPGIPVPEVYGYDDSRTICSSPCFFMEKLEGASLYSIKGSLSQEALKDITRRIGAVNKKINSIVCPRFGFPGQPAYQGQEWFDVFRGMLRLGASDAAAREIRLNIDLNRLWACLERDRVCFEEVREPRLVHWDCWEGNIFIKDGNITGIIDWERSLWADPLMEVGFRRYRSSAPFFREGYGMETMTETQERRALWYDIYLMLLISLEYEYRRYETSELSDWAAANLAEYGALL